MMLQRNLLYTSHQRQETGRVGRHKKGIGHGGQEAGYGTKIHGVEGKVGGVMKGHPARHD
jgi:hypothetical protein